MSSKNHRLASIGSLYRLASQVLATALALIALTLSAGAWADISKASDWVGRSVVTSSGEPLGRIEDLAIDIESASIKYLVVSIASFLIEDSLIAVHPDALQPSAEGQALVLHSDELAAAKRFNPDNWPATADVLATVSSADQALVSAGEQAADDTVRGFDRGGRATISDGQRQATYAAGERRIEVLPRATVTAEAASTEYPPSVDPRTLPLPSFKSLDSNGDGALSRREIGARLSRHEPFPSVDVDGNGELDNFELELLKDARKP